MRPAPVASLRARGASGDGNPSPEDQPLEVIDEVGHPDFHPGAVDADGANEEVHPVLLLGEDVLYARADDRFARWRGGQRPASVGPLASCDERRTENRSSP